MKRWPTKSPLHLHNDHGGDPGEQPGSLQRDVADAESRATLHVTAWRRPHEAQHPSCLQTRSGGTTRELPPATSSSSFAKSQLWLGHVGQTYGLDLNCDLNGTSCKALVDTGSTISLEIYITKVTGECTRVQGKGVHHVTTASWRVLHVVTTSQRIHHINTASQRVLHAITTGQGVSTL
ncbi:unnamed protein product [Merluccius merluccius]